MFLQQKINGGNLNECAPKDQIVPGKDGSTCYLECYYCHEWVHMSNNCPQILQRCECARTGGRSGTGAL